MLKDQLHEKDKAKGGRVDESGQNRSPDDISEKKDDNSGAGKKTMMMRRQKAHQRQTPDRPGEVGCSGVEGVNPKRGDFWA